MIGNATSSGLIRRRTQGLDVVTVVLPGFRQHFVTAHAATGDPHAMFGNMAAFLRETGAHTVTQYVFGGCELHAEGLDRIEESCGAIEWPVTWIEADGASGPAMTGTQIMAVEGIRPRPVRLDGRIVGNLIELPDADCCLLGDVLPADVSAPRADQTRLAFERMEMALRGVGMDFSHVVRTWMYLNRLLEWYGEFNRARTAFFQERGVFERLVPASTGIGVANPQGAALVTDALAIRPRNGGVTIRPVASPMQCAATDYRSSFSRAVEIAFANRAWLIISGTASIAPDGSSVHQGDVRKQIELTMEVVEAILRSRGMAWADTTRAIAYFRRIEDAPVFHDYLRRAGLAELPVALAHADVCRDELLFEIEVDACRIGKAK
jgi:enamine deaminase RidA (YjgF/YER057c/UK114 family)